MLTGVPEQLVVVVESSRSITSGRMAGQKEEYRQPPLSLGGSTPALRQ